jgi:hypothetical protein
VECELAQRSPADWARAANPLDAMFPPFLAYGDIIINMAQKTRVKGKLAYL